MMGLKFTNLVMIGQVSWSAITQCNPRIDGVLWIKGQSMDLNIVLDNVVDSTGVDMQAHEVAMHEA